MKHIFTLTLTWLVFLTLIINNPASAQKQIKKDKPITLKHWMTPEEAKLKHLIGKDAQATEPPEGPITNIAEFDKMQSVLIRYSFGISYNLIAEMSEKCMITTIVANTNEQTNVINQYNNNGVNMDNTEFIIAPSDSYWTRDYGPWFVIDGNDELGIIDFTYNRPRPTDNAIPSKVAQEFGFNLFEMDIVTAGGNYMTDGMGISASSDLIWEENPGYSHDEIAEIYEDYLGINTYHVLPDPNNTYIDHIDCWGKFLDVDKVLIRSVPQSHPQYDEIEATAAYFETQTSSYGNYFQVFRVYTPNDQPYTNSLILNKRVFVPITNSQWDDEALASYQEAMPGYEVFGFTGSWESTDALHCRTKGVADQNMVHISHLPLLNQQPVQTNYEIEATIKTFSGAELYADSVLIYYRSNGAAWQIANMSNTSGQIWLGTIPGANEGSQIDYYLYAVDQDANRQFHPFIGAPDPHVFYVGEQAYAHIDITPGEINTSATQGQTVTEILTICNTGLLELNFNIETNTAMYGDVDYSVSNSPGYDTYNYNTWEESNWTEFDVIENGELSVVEVSYTWSSDNWPEEGSFYLLSPDGTQTTIAAGTSSGTYTVDMTAFDGEEMNGIWRMWIEDAYGDGGHEATNITVNFTYVISEIEWITAGPATGTIAPDDCMDIDIICDATELQTGLHEGIVTVASNDPDFPEIEIPVQFEVTGLGQLTVSPDTLWFLDENAIFEGRTATVFNNSDVDVTINEIPEYGGTSFSWWIDQMSHTLPHTLSPNQELTFHVLIDIPLDEELINMAYDSVLVASDAGDYYTIIAIDLDIITGINKNNNNGITVYPSPFKNDLTINLSKYNEAVDKIIISDLTGKVVEIFDKNTIADDRLIWKSNNSAVQIKEGVYLIQIFAGNKSEVIKVVKMK